MKCCDWMCDWMKMMCGVLNMCGIVLWWCLCVKCKCGVLE